ncbi:hypothetical protein Aph02nite_91270 [Actinoplanes philippinensis]|uniref:Suppressor of fused protein (SUFU) n=1 Tax=Actinoplanes philippinensis TaxID=35752 RepID=A0A1I2MWB9_9ACTN|nr:suppressor of fused domain protein [Actinoplanes philippinensis]GIE83177.1 hypothetical protein Aph02nite_91270 [Actinoplanes philippinensis]SFF93636.1 Suppressor of fused protein (SUFU) [Actinoplanes philippinensis]
MPPFALGGGNPLDGVSFYPRTDHWHLVGYGMSELYARDEDAEETEESGWGFELTFRIARDPGDDEPPMWAADLLQWLARYVYSTGNWFEPGHHLDANGPISPDRPTAMTALAFAEDPELGAIGTPHGRLQFLQVVGLTGDEYEAARRWDTQGVLGLLAARDNPLLITDPDRPSATDDPAVRAAVEAGRERDGSSTGLLLLAGFTWTAPSADGVRLRFKEISAPLAAQAVRDRLAHGRPLILDGDGHTRLLLTPAPAYAVRPLPAAGAPAVPAAAGDPASDVPLLSGVTAPGDGVSPAAGALEIDLPEAAIAALPGLLVPGVHPVPHTDGLTVEVIAS